MTSPTQLPLGRTLLGAFALLLERRAALAHAVVLPFVAFTLMNGWSVVAPDAANAALPVLLVLRLALMTLFAVTVHRLILEGANTVPAYGIGPFGLREIRYLGWSLVQGLAVAVVAIAAVPLIALNQLFGMVVALIAGAWLVGRVALALPEIALERPLDVSAVWALGQGTGFTLALIVVGVPMFGAVLMYPFAASGSFVLQTVGVAGSLLTMAWAVASLALAWQHQVRQRDSAVDVSGSPAPAVNLGPDAARGLLELDVQGAFAPHDYGHVATGNGLHAYHGRLRGLVIALHGDHWEGSEQAWGALDTLLSHLGFVRIHHEHLERVALVAPGDWQALADRLAKHFAHAEVRVFPQSAVAGARAWSAREG